MTKVRVRKIYGMCEAWGDQWITFKLGRWMIDKNSSDSLSFPGSGFQPMWKDSDSGMTHSRKDDMWQ